MTQGASLDELYLYFSICLAMIFVGTSIIYATWKNVKFFVDPSPDSLFTMSQTLIKKVVGTKGLLIYWYVFGTCFLVVGIAGFFMGLLRLLKSLMHLN